MILQHSKYLLMLGLLAPQMGCHEWNNEPNTLSSYSDSIAIGDSIFLITPTDEVLYQLTPGAPGEESYTDLEDFELQRHNLDGIPLGLRLTPDGNTLAALSHGTDDRLEIVQVGDGCSGESVGSCISSIDSKALHDQLVFSPDSSFAVSYISPESARSSSEAIVNLNEIGIYDLTTLESQFLTVGYNPKAFAFTSAGDQMVVLTESDLSWVDLSTGTSTKRSLTLNSSTTVTPQAVTITADNTHALVTIQNSPDLYTFDLTESTLPINILSLSGPAMDMQASPDGLSTIVLSKSGYALDIIDNSSFYINSLELSSPASTLISSPDEGYMLAYWPNSSKMLHHFDLDLQRVTSYLLDNPAYDIEISPDGHAAAIFYAPDNSTDAQLNRSYGVAILNFSQGDRQATPVLLANRPNRSAFVKDDTSNSYDIYLSIDLYPHSILASIDMSTYQSSTTSIPPYPSDIYTLENDSRVIAVHRTTTGLVSLVNKLDNEFVQFISGFMAYDLFTTESEVE